MVNIRFLEMNGVYSNPAPKPKPTVSNFFLEMNGVYTPPAPKPVVRAPVAPRPNITTTTKFLEINGVLNGNLQSLSNTVGGGSSYTPPVYTPPPATVHNYWHDPLGLGALQTRPQPVPIRVAPPPPPPAPSAAEIYKAEARVAAEIMAGRDADRMHFINPETGQEYTDAEINDISKRIDTYKADQRVVRELEAGRDPDRMHFINPRTGGEYTDREIAEIDADLKAKAKQEADARVAREIMAGRDADRMHFIDPSTGMEYSDAEIGRIAEAVEEHETYEQQVADGRVAREIVAGRDADRMHFINPETGQEYTDAEINAIAAEMKAWEQQEADAKVAQQVVEGRDAERIHLINPGTGRLYTDAEIRDITNEVHAHQREQLAPVFEAEVKAKIDEGNSRAVAEQLTAFAFVQSGLPAHLLPEGIKAPDLDDVFTQEHAQFDTGRDIVQGNKERTDGFVSFEDLDSIIANPDMFEPDVVATAMIFRQIADQEGNEEFAENFEKQSLLDRIKESPWLDPNSDSIVVNFTRMATGLPPSGEFIARVREDGFDELKKIASSSLEVGRLINIPQNIAMTGYEIVTADDPMAALRAAPGQQWDMYSSFGAGVGDWVVDTGKLGIGLAAISVPGGAEFLEYATGVNVHDEIKYAAEGLFYGFIDDPDGLAKGLVGYDLFIEDPHRWAGQQAPDIVIDIVTGGFGTVGRLDNVALAANRLPPPSIVPGQQRLFDADNFLDIPGQQRLFDGDAYLDVPDITPDVRGQIPGQRSLFDEGVDLDVPVQQSLLDDLVTDGSNIPSDKEALGREFFDPEVADPMYSGDISVSTANRPGGVSLFPWNASDLPTNGLKGMNLEGAVHNTLHAEGYNVFSLTNNSGHGTDIIAVRPGDTPEIYVIEVKANSSSLSELQQLGGPAHLDNVIGRARSQNHWNTVEFDQFLKDNGIAEADLADNGSFLIARQKGIEADALITDSSIIEVSEWTPGTTGTANGQRRVWDTLDSLNYPPLPGTGN